MNILDVIILVVVMLGLLELKHMKKLYGTMYLILFLFTTIILKWQNIYPEMSFFIDSLLFTYIIYFKISRIIDEKRTKKNT